MSCPINAGVGFLFSKCVSTRMTSPTTTALQFPFLATFDEHFAPLLECRAASFRVLFEEMERRATLGHTLQIVETGCARQRGNWAGDGQSTVLFDAFVRRYPSCRLDSFDINPESCDIARQLVQERENVRIHCKDAVRGLWSYPRCSSAVHIRPIAPRIDVLYLDSFDVDFSNPLPSALHHLKELAAAMGKLAPSAIVVVDDNLEGRGKGTFVREMLDTIGGQCCFDGYQLVYRMPPPPLPM